jgi:hypothetical protein
MLWTEKKISKHITAGYTSREGIILEEAILDGEAIADAYVKIPLKHLTDMV